MSFLHVSRDIVSGATTPAGAAAALRGSVPTADALQEFLRRGALFPWSEDLWILGWGEPRRSAGPDTDRPSFYAPDFLLREGRPWFVYPHFAAVAPDWLAQEIPRDGSARPARAWEPFDEESFARTFHEVLGAIRRGALRKAVPIAFETSRPTLGLAERAHSLHALATLPSGLLPYGFWEERGGLIGASPELLFECDGAEIRTMAVAGTARSGRSPDEMLDDPKERAEHEFVVEDIVDQLSPLGSLTRGAVRLWRIGILSHLRTDLRLLPSKPPSFPDLVARLHPTAALGVSPRRQSAEWLPLLDPSGARGRFGAPFGLRLPGGCSRCLVAIRNVQWDGAGCRCGAGCGIVEGSELPRETAELRLKLAATRGNLGL